MSAGAITAITNALRPLCGAELGCLALDDTHGLPLLCFGLRVALAGRVEIEADPRTPEHDAAIEAHSYHYADRTLSASGAITAIASALQPLLEAELGCIAIGASGLRLLCAGLREELAGLVETKTDPGTPEHDAALKALSSGNTETARPPIATDIEALRSD